MPTLLERNWNGAFFDRWESLPEEKRQLEKNALLAGYISFARSQSPFYQERLSGFDPKASHPLEKVPVLTSEDIRQVVPPLGNKLLVTGASGYTVFQSGGTTGLPKTTLFSCAELDGLDRLNARGFFACGLVREDRVANCWAVGSLYMTFVHINRMLQQYGCENYPFSNQTPVPFIHTVVKQFGVNCITGIASVVLNALRGIVELGREGIEIDKIYFGGEQLYETDRREIEKNFGTKIICAPGYGTVDTWYLGYQCLKCPPGVFHAHDDDVFLEIVDEETGRACGSDEAGMLYATAFPRRVTPIVRYRVGDRVKWLGNLCGCGRTTPLFQLLGRGDDVLRIGYDSVDYAFIQSACSRLPAFRGR